MGYRLITLHTLLNRSSFRTQVEQEIYAVSGAIVEETFSSMRTVTIDDIDLCDLNVHALRDQIGVVSQEPILFDGTLYENIKMGCENATDEQVEEACRLANASEFIKQLPDGYATRVGERGVQLSGGQKQRIAIARAIIKDPKILLLDEATSALDSEAETIVQEALEKAQMNRTTVIVAHRLSTIRNVDQIFVFKNGEIVEQGTHKELMDKRGAFYDMTQAQVLRQQKEVEPQGLNKNSPRDVEKSVENSPSNIPGVLQLVFLFSFYVLVRFCPFVQHSFRLQCSCREVEIYLNMVQYLYKEVRLKIHLIKCANA
ncbi:ABC transporter, ATP-binding protein [Oesophagostomum dentatum]|uniref:ABC transporter, ATP-binding protein n=1 Tax=Oesophagostomum dentatum TaxID=61180 RepID=A0A0B1TU21_OESDE|nr:ABC transporter, ATP-binding protein [Oesophagostomum dentatum]